MKIRRLVFVLFVALCLPVLAEEAKVPLPAVPAVPTMDPELDPVLDLSPLDGAVAMCSPQYNQCTIHCDETVDPTDPYAWVCYQYCLCWYCGAPCP